MICALYIQTRRHYAQTAHVNTYLAHFLVLLLLRSGEWDMMMREKIRCLLEVSIYYRSLLMMIHEAEYLLGGWGGVLLVVWEPTHWWLDKSPLLLSSHLRWDYNLCPILSYCFSPDMDYWGVILRAKCHLLLELSLMLLLEKVLCYFDVANPLLL